MQTVLLDSSFYVLLFSSGGSLCGFGRKLFKQREETEGEKEKDHHQLVKALKEGKNDETWTNLDNM